MLGTSEKPHFSPQWNIYQFEEASAKGSPGGWAILELTGGLELVFPGLQLSLIFVLLHIIIFQLRLEQERKERKKQKEKVQ